MYGVMPEPTGSRNQGDESAAGLSIWEVPEGGQRGPRPRFTRAEIAAAAIAIADRDGLGRVTVRDVAAELGMATMTLYGYVPSKEDLAELMVDALMGEYAFPDAPAADYRAAIVALAVQARDIARRHPWLAQLTARRPPVPGPNGLKYLDGFLGLLRGSGLGTEATLELVALISGFATMYGAMLATPAHQTRAPAARMAKAAASGQYPHLTAALACAGPPRSDEEVFQSCITRLVDAMNLSGTLQRDG
jgi:AcrR family transcriptional regulator